LIGLTLVVVRVIALLTFYRIHDTEADVTIAR